MRLEIQGLRAVAVLSVVVFHVWPSLLTGGYVGVDVFFVISGYLITGLLLREDQRNGTISLMGFYAKRVRRLLPASTAVIVAIAASVTVLPTVQWADTAIEILAGAFYVQNWWLAFQSVDYLAEDNAPGLLRHYWSLSVEEQYYIVWPLVFLGVGAVTHVSRSRTRAVFGVIIGLIAVASLAYSVYLTEANPGLAYFATTTRAWELALGGLLAVGLPGRERAFGVWAPLLGWVGVIAIALACLVFNETTRFPGYAALLPTLGAALVIVAGRSDEWWSSYRLLTTKPMQYIGNISYSLYLWHWPVLVLYTVKFEGPLCAVDGFVVVGVSLFLAHLTKLFVEDPFRQKSWRQFAWINRPFVIGALSFSLALSAAKYVWVLNNNLIIQMESRADSAGLSVLLGQAYDPSRPVHPPLLQAKKDNPDVYRLGCHADQVTSTPLKCEFGVAHADYHLVLVGDSHAAQWLPSLQALLPHRKWRITTFTKSACAFNAVPVVVGKQRAAYDSCTEWNQRVMEELAVIKPNVIVTSQWSGHYAFGSHGQEESNEVLAAGLLARWRELRRQGFNVLVVRDTPRMDKNPVECLAASHASVEKCATKRSVAFKQDPIMLAMKKHPNVIFLDLSKRICDADLCRPVKGQILIWRDRHHITATYARALSEEFIEILTMVE